MKTPGSERHPLAGSRPSALVYGDVDLNLLDGSAIWLQSVTQALVAAGCAVTLVLKAPVRTEPLIAPLRTTIWSCCAAAHWCPPPPATARSMAASGPT